MFIPCKLTFCSFGNRDLVWRQVIEFVNQTVDMAVERGTLAFIEVLVTPV
jgi:hypothetical protein